jgi:GTPase SAR1 family protein
MPFAQLVVGPPGSGKSTYCRAARQYLRSKLGRDVALVNLDPSCEDPLPASAASAAAAAERGDSDDERPVAEVDVRELVTAEEVMERLSLGPNGALMFCIELLAKNLAWLDERLAPLAGRYVIFDCPGQVELYTHHAAMRTVVEHLERKLHFRLCTVHLVDSYMCSDVGSFVSALLVSMSAMMRMETPHINVLSKIDLAEAMGRLAFRLEYYTEVLDLSYLLDRLADDPLTSRYRALNTALAELVEDFSLVSFYPLNVQDEELMASLTRAIDRSCGYLYTSAEDGAVDMESAAFPAEPYSDLPGVRAHERYIVDDDELEGQL